MKKLLLNVLEILGLFFVFALYFFSSSFYAIFRDEGILFLPLILIAGSLVLMTFRLALNSLFGDKDNFLVLIFVLKKLKPKALSLKSFLVLLISLVFLSHLGLSLSFHFKNKSLKEQLKRDEMLR